jgi:hypothetical protein
MLDLVERVTGEFVRPGRRFVSIKGPVSIFRLGGESPGILFV